MKVPLKRPDPHLRDLSGRTVRLLLEDENGSSPRDFPPGYGWVEPEEQRFEIYVDSMTDRVVVEDDDRYPLGELGHLRWMWGNTVPASSPGHYVPFADYVNNKLALLLERIAPLVAGFKAAGITTASLKVTAVERALLEEYFRERIGRLGGLGGGYFHSFNDTYFGCSLQVVDPKEASSSLEVA